MKAQVGKISGRSTPSTEKRGPVDVQNGGVIRRNPKAPPYGGRSERAKELSRSGDGPFDERRKK